MEDDFIEDEYMEEEEGSSGNNRPFLVAVGALVTVFILAAACTLIFMNMGQQGANNSVEVAAIETQNAITIVTNTAVAQFIAQTETAQAMPTNAPEVAATNTPTPAAAKDTPRPTRVLEGSGDGSAGDGTVEGGTVITGTAEATPEGGGASGTIIIVEGDGSGDTGSGDTGSSGGNTDSEAAGGGSGTDGSAAASGTKDAASTDSGSVVVAGTPVSTATGSAQGEALPQTGLEIWVIAFAGLLLVGVLMAARRLRA